MSDGAARPSRAGLYLALAGLLPLACGLVLAALVAASAVQGGNTAQEWTNGGVALALALVGVANVRLGVTHGRRQCWEHRARREHPAEPWRWRRDWDERRLVAGVTGDTMATGVFAAVWLGFSLFITWAMFIHENGSMKPPAFMRAIFGVGFPLIGGYLLIAFVHQLWRFLRFGRSELRLARLPAEIGGWFAGTVSCRVPARDGAVFAATLTCTHRVGVGSGEDRRVEERRRWTGETLVAGVPDPDRPGRLLVPVCFAIPPGLPASGEDDEGVIRWDLSLGRGLRGVDYLARFTVPVFAVAATQPAPEPPPAVDDPGAATGRIGFAEEPGQVRVTFPAMLNPAMAQLPVIIAAPALMTMWWGWHEGSLLSVVLAAPVAGCALYSWLRAWFMTTEITAAGRAVRVRKRLLLLSWERTYDPVQGVRLDSSWQETGGGQPGRSFRKLTLTVDGRQVAVGSAMHRHGLAERIRAALDRQVQGG